MCVADSWPKIMVDIIYIYCAVLQIHINIARADGQRFFFL